MSRIGFWKAKIKRRKKVVSRVCWSILGVAAGLIIVQLAMPYDRFLPRQKIDGMDVGMMDYAEAQKNLESSYYGQKVEFRLDGRGIGEAKVDETGIEVDVTRQIEKAKYSLRDRFIPGTVFYKVFFDAGILPKITVDVERANQYLERNYATICAVPPVNATVAVVDGRLKLNDDQRGLLCDEGRFLGDIVAEDLTLARSMTVEVSGKTIDALVTSEGLREIFDKVRGQLINGVSLSLSADKNLTVRYSDMIKWLNVETDVFGHVDISYSDDKIREYLTRSVAPLVKQVSGVTVVTELNGIEVSRKEGGDGQDLDYEKVIAEIRSFLDRESTGAEKIVAATVVTKPIVKYKRTFTKNFAGMLSLFETRIRSTEDMVRVVDLSGRNMTQAAKDDQPFESRWATRLVVMFLSLREGQNEQIDKKCFDKLLVEYDEACVENLASAVDVAGLLRVNGLEQTSLNGKMVTTTAGDIAKLLLVLNGDVDEVTQAAREKLLGKVRGGSISLSKDEEDRLVTAGIITMSGGSYIVVMASENRGQAKETLGLIEDLFKVE